MRNKITMMIVVAITLLITTSCSVNKFDNSIRRIAVISPNIDLIVVEKLSFKNGYSGVHYTLPNQLYPCFPEDLLSAKEKGVLDYLISETITELSNQSQAEIIKVNCDLIKNTILAEKLISDSKFFDKFPLTSNYENIDVLSYDSFSQSIQEADSLFYVTLYHNGLASLKALTGTNKAKFSGNIYELDHQKVKDYSKTHNSIDILESFIKNKDEFTFLLENSVYCYAPANYCELTAIEKWDYKEICNELKVDALLFLDFDFFGLPWPKLNPLSKTNKISISLNGKIRLVDKKKRVLLKKTIKAESNKYDFEESERPEQRNEFIIKVANDKLIIAKKPNIGRNNFSLENNYSELYREAIIDFLVKMRDALE